jgi:hypothetical protein
MKRNFLKKKKALCIKQNYSDLRKAVLWVLNRFLGLFSIDYVGPNSEKPDSSSRWS